MRHPVRMGTALLLVCAWLPAGAAAQEASAPALAEQRVLEHSRRLEQAGRSDEAMRALENLLDRDPNAVSALLLLSQIAERTGEVERALARTEEAVQRDDSAIDAVRQVWIRTLRAAGLPDSARRAAGRWIREDPLNATAYGELSALEANEGDLEAAVRVLREGRENTGSSRAFVQELAALEAGLGHYDAAAAEWRSILAWGPPGVEAVARDLESLGAGQPEALRALAVALDGSRASALERKGGASLALLVGEPEWAKELTRKLAQDLPGAAGEEVLRDFVRRASDAGDPAGAAWAAAELAERSRTRSDAQYWLGMSAAYSAEAGASEDARVAFERLRRATQPGSDLYELSLRHLHELMVERSPREADALLEEYRSIYGDRNATLVAMSVRSAEEWLDRGDLERARADLEAVSPSDAREAALQGGALGRLELLAGRPAAARGPLQLAASVATGDPTVRVAALERLAMLDRADSGAVRSAARVVSEARDSGDSEDLLRSVRAWATAGVSGGDLLAAFAAREMDAAARTEAAAAIRREIVVAWPGSSAAPRAMLDLARHAVPKDPSRAREWLERLIVEYPESALAPVARRLLYEVEGGSPGA